MKLLAGLLLGVVGMWLYRSEQARQKAQQMLGSTPQPVQNLGHTVASATTSSAQRVGGVIDASPLPDNVKAAAARVTRRTTTEGDADKGAERAPDYIGTPGVESAGGRDRTAPGGDLPPDLARP
jgi:hypothetical protein